MSAPFDRINRQLNKAFEHRLRLGVMGALHRGAKIDFNGLKKLLGASDGNLASHLALLESNGYIAVKKEFVGKKPCTSYIATSAGRKAFLAHVTALQEFIHTLSPSTNRKDR